MDQQPSRPLVLERISRRFSENWLQDRLPFLASLLFGLLAYTFAFTNKLVNHDEVQSLFLKGATVDSGRWGLGLLDSVFPNISMPWIYGIFSLLFIAAAVCLLVRIFSIRRKLLQVLLAGCVVVFPSLIGTFGYMFTSCCFALAFLLAVLSVSLLKENGLPHFLAALGCMIFSLSIYQSYISVAAGLLVVLLIWQLLLGEKPAAVTLRGLRYLLFLILALGGYYAATQLFLKLLHVEMNSYASGNVSFHLASLPAGIAQAYHAFFLYFSQGFRGLMPTALSRIAHGLSLTALVLLLLRWKLAQADNSLGRYLLLVLLLFLLPLAINCMYLFTVPEAIHTLVLYGFVGFYVLLVVVADLPDCGSSGRIALLHRLALECVTVCLSLVILVNTYVANAAFLNLHLRYENAYAFYSSLTTQIKTMPEFTEGTKLAVLGTYQEPDFYGEHFAFLEELTGVKGFLPDSYSRGKFLEYYLGLPLPAPTEAECAAIAVSPEYAAMAVYPYYGSVQLIGDTIVVKLSP